MLGRQGCHRALFDAADLLELADEGGSLRVRDLWLLDLDVFAARRHRLEAWPTRIRGRVLLAWPADRPSLDRVLVLSLLGAGACLGKVDVVRPLDFLGLGQVEERGLGLLVPIDRALVPLRFGFLLLVEIVVLPKLLVRSPAVFKQVEISFGVAELACVLGRDDDISLAPNPPR